MFPVSAAILDRIRAYRTTLEDYSKRLLPVVDWKPTERGNVTVLNDTADFYRFFDATAHAEFLYGCVRHTVEHDLPEETKYLQQYDAFNTGVNLIVDMPERLSNLLFQFLRQNDGKLSHRSRTREFAQLTEDEISRAEALYRETFGEEARVTTREGGKS